MGRLSSAWFAGWPDVVAAGYALAVCAWLLLGTPGGPLTTLVGDLVFLPLGLIVGALAWGNGRRAGEARTRAAWWLLAAAAWSLWATGALYAIFDPTLAGTEVKWWVPLVYFPLVSAGLLAFPRAPLVGRDRARYLLDLGLTVVAGLVLVLFIEIVSAGQATQEDGVSRLTAAFVEWAAFVASVNAYLRAAGPVQRRVFGAWLSAAALYVAANVAFGLVRYQPGHWVDGLWFGAWVCRWVGVRAPAAMAPAAFSTPVTREPVPYELSAVPYFFLAVSFLLLLWVERAGLGSLPLAVGAGAMTALLVLRHLAELRENRRLFAAQLEQQARFRSLVQHSSDVVIVAGDDGVATYVSPSVARVFGESGGLQVGASVLELLDAGEEPGLKGILERRGTRGRFTASLRLASGVRELEIDTTDLRDDPAVAGLVLNCRDVTDRNDLQRQLQHAQKLEAVGQLAGGLAHEFNNLLAVIRGSAEMLEEDLRHLAVGRQPLQQIEQCVDRAAALTRKVLAFSRRQAVQPTVLDLDQVLQEILPILKQLLRPGLEVRLVTGAGGWRIRADQGQVEQVVINLVANARDAVVGAGCIEVRTRTCRAAGADGGGPVEQDYVALAVEDQGTGMEPEVRAHIFEPFFTTKPREQGSGLGLAMVHGIVVQAGGRIEVQTTPGAGSTFTVMWPRTLDELAAGPADPARNTPLGRGRSVLVVDDEPGVRHYVQRALAHHGFRVVAAADGTQALEVAARPAERIDVLLTDLVMPRMTGQQLAERFRALRPGVPVVGMTGFAALPLSPSAGGDDMAAVLTKPFRIDALLRTLDAVTDTTAFARPALGPEALSDN